MNRKHISFTIPWPNLSQVWTFVRKWLLPNPGTLVLMVVLAIAMPAIAGAPRASSATSSSTISYQGRLADSSGNPLTDKYNMEFRIYDVPSDGTPLWTEMWTGANAVDVSDGLFNVMLGSIDNTLASSIQGHDELYLGITVGTDSEMVPRVQLGSVPFSMQAMTVPEGSITTGKIADGAVTQAKLGPDVNLLPPAESITTTMLADDAVTGAKIAHQFGVSNKTLLNYVVRENLSSWDWTSTIETGNGVFIDWDLSSIVSSEAVAVVVCGMFRDDHIDSRMVVRRNGTTHSFNEPEPLYLFSNPPNNWHKETTVIPLSGGRSLEVEIFDANGSAVSAARLVVLGWWEPAEAP
jgi:hypothetical protein